MTAPEGAWHTVKRLLGLGPASSHGRLSPRRRAVLLGYQVAGVIAIVLVDPAWAKVVAFAVFAFGSAAIAAIGTPRRE